MPCCLLLINLQFGSMNGKVLTVDCTHVSIHLLSHGLHVQYNLDYLDYSGDRLEVWIIKYPGNQELINMN